MPRLHALELLPDEEGAERVRADWRALRDAGLPSQLDHRGATNTPHVTVLAAPALDEAAERAASLALGPLLPVVVRVPGLLLLGGAKVTIARALDVDDDLADAVRGARAATPGREHDGWLPHVTLARRVPRERVPDALAVLDDEVPDLRFVELRRWDPDAGSVRTLHLGGSTP